MNVVQHGISPATWKTQVVCPRCNAHLEVCCKDIKLTTTKKATLLSLKPYKLISHYHVICMECGYTIKLPEHSIPSVICEAIIQNMSLLELLLNFYY